MIHSEIVNGFKFIAQTTFFMYVENREEPILTTSDVKTFEQQKELARDGSIQARNSVSSLLVDIKEVKVFEFENTLFRGNCVEIVKRYRELNPSDKFYIWLHKQSDVEILGVIGKCDND